MATKTIKKPQPKVSTPIDKIYELFDSYDAMKETLFEDYIVDDGLITELIAAEETLQKGIEKVIENYEVVQDPTFARAKEILEEVELTDDDISDLFESIIDEKDMLDRVVSQGYVLIKIDSMALRSKLEEFIKSEIYPFYSDQQSFLEM